MANYTIEERRFVVLFTFKTRSEAQEFTLPMKYQNKYVLNEIILDGGSKEFIRIAQVM